MMHPECLISYKHPRLAEIEEFANSYVGVPWKAGAYSPLGMDCVGLVVRVGLDLKLYDERKVKIPPWTQIPTRNELLGLFRKWLVRIPQPIHGCVALFKFPNTPIHHVGIIGEKYLYHAASEHGKVVKVTLSPAALKYRRSCFIYERPDNPTTDVSAVKARGK